MPYFTGACLSVSSRVSAASCWPGAPSLGKFSFWSLLVSKCRRRSRGLLRGRGC